MKESLSKKILEKTAKDYEKIAEEFSSTRFLLWPEFEEFKQYIKEGDHILDLGCGNGRLYELFKDLSTPLNNSAKGKIASKTHLTGSIDYTGVDQSPALIKDAKEKWKGTKVNFKVGNILNLPNLGENGFDAVFLVAVLHHIPEHKLRLEILKQAHVLLKPGGYLFMTNWMFWQKKYFPLILKYTMLKLIGKNKMDFGDIYVPWRSGGIKTYGKIDGKLDRYFHAFTKREIKRLVGTAGFKIVKNKKSKWNYVTICKKD